MNIVACDYERHAAAILEILNDAIVNSTALFDYKPRAPETMVEWFRAKREKTDGNSAKHGEPVGLLRTEPLDHCLRRARLVVDDGCRIDDRVVEVWIAAAWRS